VSCFVFFQHIYSMLLLRNPRPIVDGHDHIIAALTGQPNGPQWDSMSYDAAEGIHIAGVVCNFTPKQAEHWEGSFPVLAAGVLFGYEKVS
jgi:hypothetical protein